jgi:hypothetical protein
LDDLLRDWWPGLLLLAVLGGLFLVLRNPASQLNTWAEFEARFDTGQPVLIEIYSNT